MLQLRTDWASYLLSRLSIYETSDWHKAKSTTYIQGYSPAENRPNRTNPSEPNIRPSYKDTHRSKNNATLESHTNNTRAVPSAPETEQRYY